MKRLLVALLFFYISNAICADSDVYLCTDEHGVKEYRNTGLNKSCKKVDLPGITTIPATAVKKSAKSAISPGNFPQVDDATQKRRDSDRKKILSDELAAEQKKLNDLNTEYKNGEPDRLGDDRNYAKYQERTSSLKDDVARTQKNIEALQREISKTNQE